MFTIFIGKLGSGKTLYLVYLASKLKRPIWSNFKLYFDNYVPLDYSDIPKLPTNVNVFMDEIYAWLDCRMSLSKRNRYISYINLQSRKTFTYIYGTLQIFTMMDIRYQLLYDYLIEAKSYGSQIYNGMIVPEYFEYTIKDAENNILNVRILEFNEAVKLIDKYDSLEIIEPSDMNSLESEFIISNKKSLKEKLSEIIKVIEPNLERITHTSVKVALYLNEFPTEYAPFIYNVLKGNISLDGV